MSESLLILSISLLMLVFSNVYWAFYCSKLLNRLMSRNYAEMVQVKTQAEIAKAEIEQGYQAANLDDAFDPVSLRQSREINSLAGIL